MLQLPECERPEPITAVLFDFHRTLVDGGNPILSLDAAWARAGRAGSAREVLGAERHQNLVHRVYHLWDHIREVDPDSERDLSPERHREIFGGLMAQVPDLDPGLIQGFYDVMPEMWRPYQDSLPTLTALKRLGLRIALVSNCARDVRPVLERAQLLELFDAVILSFEVGAVKPHPPIFRCALEALGVAPANALMVGDNSFDDAGAARLGLRTLILPRTEGPCHGLDAVVRLAGS